MLREQITEEDDRTIVACETAANVMRALAVTMSERNPHAEAFREWAVRLEDQAVMIRRGAAASPAGLREVR